jgi:cysteinyl-tRNA synthetase
VERIRDAGRRLRPGPSPPELSSLREAFFDALADDFNTARALAAAYEWIREANRLGGAGDADLREMLLVLGLDGLLDAPAAGAPAEIEALAAQRAEARARRDFAEADRLREELRARGWEVRDGPQGPELVPAAA